MAQASPKPSAPSGSSLAAGAALGANLALASAKLVAAALTGSAAMLSEALHSVGDSVSQISLLVGIRESERRPDRQHPYGYGRSRWVWALISAVGVLFVGAGASVFNGLDKLVTPEPLENLGWAIGVLGAAFLLEGISFLVAVRTVRRAARETGVSMATYMRTGADPVAVAVVLEDGAALVGVAIAAATLALAAMTGEARWDAAGSIAIGGLLATSAVFLVRRNIDLLTGRAIPDRVRAEIIRVLEQTPAVEEVMDVKTTVLGAESARFKAEVEVDGRAVARRWIAENAERFEALRRALDVDEARLQRILGDFAGEVVDELGAEIDRIEARIRDIAPEIEHIDLEIHRGGDDD